MAGLLFIISAPSGSGKSTLVSQLRSMVDNLDFSVSWTTRPPRGSEQEGREYHFTSREDFERMIAAGEFLENANVFGNHYGTPRSSLTQAAQRGRDLLLDIDVQGAAQVRRKVPQAISIFILPPNPQVLAMRLNNRSRAEGSVPEEIIQKRLAKAREEIANFREYRYVIVNDILEQAAEELMAIVLAERYKAMQPDSLTPEQERWRQLADRCSLKNSCKRLESVLASFGLSM